VPKSPGLAICTRRDSKLAAVISSGLLQIYRDQTMQIARGRLLSGLSFARVSDLNMGALPTRGLARPYRQHSAWTGIPSAGPERRILVATGVEILRHCCHPAAQSVSPKAAVRPAVRLGPQRGRIPPVRSWHIDRESRRSGRWLGQQPLTYPMLSNFRRTAESHRDLSRVLGAGKRGRFRTLSNKPHDWPERPLGSPAKGILRPAQG
jgi:hypothetical protein